MSHRCVDRVMGVNEEATPPILETDKGTTDKEKYGMGKGKHWGKLLMPVTLKFPSWVRIYVVPLTPGTVTCLSTLKKKGRGFTCLS